MAGTPQGRRKLGQRYSECGGSKEKNYAKCLFRKSCTAAWRAEWAKIGDELARATLMGHDGKSDRRMCADEKLHLIERSLPFALTFGKQEPVRSRRRDKVDAVDYKPNMLEFDFNRREREDLLIE